MSGKIKKYIIVNPSLIRITFALFNQTWVLVKTNDATNYYERLLLSVLITYKYVYSHIPISADQKSSWYVSLSYRLIVNHFYVELVVIGVVVSDDDG